MDAVQGYFDAGPPPMTPAGAAGFYLNRVHGELEQ